MNKIGLFKVYLNLCKGKIEKGISDPALEIRELDLRPPSCRVPM
jgi:hypothetical protein